MARSTAKKSAVIAQGQMREDHLRQRALELAAGYVGTANSPQGVVAAAEEFLKFLKV